ATKFTCECACSDPDPCLSPTLIHGTLNVCLPPRLNEQTGDAGAVEAIPQADYNREVQAYCAVTVARRLLLLSGWVNGFCPGDFCTGNPSCRCTLTEGAHIDNPNCDVPPQPVVCNSQNCNDGFTAGPRGVPCPPGTPSGTLCY